jgi:hypothetical protein
MRDIGEDVQLIVTVFMLSQPPNRSNVANPDRRIRSLHHLFIALWCTLDGASYATLTPVCSIATHGPSTNGTVRIWDTTPQPEKALPAGDRRAVPIRMPAAGVAQALGRLVYSPPSTRIYGWNRIPSTGQDAVTKLKRFSSGRHYGWFSYHEQEWVQPDRRVSPLE